jgi:hypothetical protein
VKNDRQGGDDPELKKWAAKTLPNLERYLTIGAEAKKSLRSERKWRRGFELPVIRPQEEMRPVARNAPAIGMIVLTNR